MNSVRNTARWESFSKKSVEVINKENTHTRKYTHKKVGGNRRSSIFKTRYKSVKTIHRVNRRKTANSCRTP